MATNFQFTLGLNTQQFQQAIGGAGRQARNLFDQLQQFSQQQQQTGFLGQGDSRALLRTMANWERMTRQLRLEQQGVQGQIQQFQAGGVLSKADQRRLNRLQAQDVLLQERETSVQTLQGGFTDWQGTQQQLQQQLQQAAAQRELQRQQTAQQREQQRQQREQERQEQSRHDRLRSYAASAGIGLLSQGGPFGRIAGGAATGFAVGGPAGAAIGASVALIGEGLAKASEAAGAWQQRARGVLAVGQLLDQNFSGITASVVRLNKEFDVLTSESVQAMEALSRVTGRFDRDAYERAVGFGVAYGMAPAQAAGLAGTLAMLGAPSPHPLRAVAAGARNAFGTGGLPMRMDVLQDEATRIAGIGGTAAAAMDPEYYGRIAGFVGGMGPRYQLPGATAGFAERLARGVSTTPDAATLMLRHRAIDQWVADLRAQGRSTEVQIGRGPNAERAELTSYEGRRIAMEQAWQSPELMDQYRRIVDQEFGFDPELRALGFERVVGGDQLGPTEARRTRRRAEQGGGFARILTAPGRATPATEAALEAEREERRRAAPEALPVRVEAAWQAMMERLGETFSPKFLETQLKLIEVEGKLEQTLREQFASLSAAVNTHFPTLGTQLEKLTTEVLTMNQHVAQAMQNAAAAGWGPLAQPFAALPDLVAPLWDPVAGRYQWPGPSDPNLYGTRPPTTPTKPTAVK
jgi:uncharacterized membrane-anchored protein YhcB (DUF1043 family)